MSDTSKEAFPRPMVWRGPDCTDDGAAGMSLRQWYVGQALAGQVLEDEPETVAARAIAIADAVLARLKRDEE